MTEQYKTSNINAPRLIREFSGVGTFAITTDDGLSVITAGAPTLTLPDARTVPGLELFIKSIPGTGTVSAILGQLIDTAASFTFTAPQQALFVKSSGAGWRIIHDGLVGGAPGTWTLISTGTTTIAPGATVTILSLTRLAAAVPFTLNYVDTTMVGEITDNDWAAMDNPGGGANIAGSRYRRTAGTIDERYSVILFNAWFDGVGFMSIVMNWRHYEVQP